jgi:trehalose 6-phosphate synthase/phosphatase
MVRTPDMVAEVTAGSGRVLIVSNRLPVSVSRENGALEIRPSAGGLATGLGGVHAGSGSVWLGWSGAATGELSAEEEHLLESRCRELNLVPVPLSADEVDRYYERFCNGVLWPALHYMINQLPLEVPDFDLYEQVNRRFAEAAVATYRPGDLIWVHDYQLMLVPQMIRERIPQARIGFFLHIPFPASDVFRILPFRERLLAGMLGADLVGFHTAAYMRHFAAAALRILGVAIDVDRMRWEQRVVRAGVFPMGVDAADFARLSESEVVTTKVAELRSESPGSPLLMVGLDRLDYTKGIPRRLLAYEHLLRQHPELRGRVRLVQVAVPSRTKVDRYQEFRSQVDTLIGRIHGQFATPSWVPVHYLYRGLPREDVVALYRAATVMLVTPIRDGMNLVAKEFVASRTDEGGVLVLSEMAGAANELAEAVHVNPYDVPGSAEAYYRALTMPEDERHTRMRALRRRVFSYDVQRWSQAFLQRLVDPGPGNSANRHPSPVAELQQLVEDARAAPFLVLLVDYDGTLVPFAATPELARPDREALHLLERLAARPSTEVHVVSGRPRGTLDRWLGTMPVTLHAEHGFWSRAPGEPGRALEAPKLAWHDQVFGILREYADRTPGSLVEEKPAGLAWHYRAADPEYGAAQANELRLHLTEILGNTPVEVLVGEKVIELRAHGVNKGRIVPPILERHPGALLVAFGDDQTDEDLFAALPPGAKAVHVGPGESQAAMRVASVREVRALLRGLL